MFDLNNVVHELTMSAIENAIRSYSGSVRFLLSLKEQVDRRGLSGPQLLAAARILNDIEASAGAAEAVESVDFSKIIAWLGNVEVQYPKFHFNVGGVELVLRYKTRGQHEGKVDVVSEQKSWNDRFGAEMPDWYGRIELDGSLVRSGRMSREIAETLVTVANDPLAAAVAYGRLTNRCSFCHRDLNHETSVALGYGPVCAKKYRLDHNKAAVETKRSLRERLDGDRLAVPCGRCATRDQHTDECVRERLSTEYAPMVS